MIEPSATPSGAQASATRTARLACVICDPAVSFGAIVGIGAKERAVELAADISVACVLTPEQQAAAIRRFVAEPVDVLIVKPLESDVVAVALRHAAETGLSIVLVDGRVGGFEPDCSVSFDNVRGAELAAAFLVDQLPATGTIVHLHGPKTSFNAFDRSYGFHSVVDHRSSIRVVEATSDWTRCAGASAMRELLNLDRSIDGVFANSDALALGAVDAIAEAGLTDEIVVTGFDGLPDALLEITRGTIAATVRQMPEAMGRLAIDVALRIHAREEVPPVVQVDFGLVTKSNVAQASVELLPIFPRILRDLIQGDSALADERALLRTLIDNLPDLIYVKDGNGRFLLVNEAAAAYIGAATPDAAVGRTDFDFFPHEYASQFRADEQALLASGRPLINHEEPVRATTGDTHWFSTTKVPTRNEIGRVVGLVGMSRDITQRKEADADRARLLEEQAALRRVAMLTARELAPVDVLVAVAEEAARALNTEAVGMLRFERDGAATLVAQSPTPWDPPPLGTRFTLDGENVVAAVHRTGQTARMDDWTNATGSVAAMAHVLGVSSAVGTPIVVEGRLWGTLIAVTNQSEPLPADIDARLGEFTELVATAIANAQSREALAALAEEQAALRRVATLVARDVSPGEIFSAVSEEVARLFDSTAGVDRFEQGSAVVIVGVTNIDIPIGTRWEFQEGMASVDVYRTGRSTRLEEVDWSSLGGEVGEASRRHGTRSIVASPIFVEGRLWGTIVVSSQRDLMPPDTETRLERFTELIGTAVANAATRQARAQLAEEQEALRHVATLVAEGVEAQVIFDAVCQETCQLLDATGVTLSHFTPDGFNELLAGWSRDETQLPIGGRLPLEPETVGGEIVRTGAPARVDSWDGLTGEMAELVRERGVRSSLGAPILVEGKLWGALVAATDREEPLPAGTEFRLARFTDLIATAISNTATRSELIASRARIVAAGDEARQRIERNLHDGTQQRLIALGLDLQRVCATIPEGQHDTHLELERMQENLESVLEDLRELSRGLHPPLLSRRGLGSSLRALARDSPIPVELEIDLPERPPAPLEIAVYYVVSEALTNAIRHSRASAISVTIEADQAGGPLGIGPDRRSRGVKLHATIADDGVGGADASAGSGLTGLADRVEALGGRFALDTPSGGGTRISIELPLEAR